MLEIVILGWAINFLLTLGWTGYGLYRINYELDAIGFHKFMEIMQNRKSKMPGVIFMPYASILETCYLMWAEYQFRKEDLSFCNFFISRTVEKDKNDD